MKILQVNKFHYHRGGADKYYLELGAALERAGYQLAYFSMLHPKNLPSDYKKYFVSRISFNEGGLADKIKAPGRIIYSLETKNKFKKLLKDFKPDIIHIHNIYHQLSPSILDVARKAGIPVVMHLHDYKLICPNYQLFAHGQICEDCKPDKYFRCARKRCFKNSYTKSWLAALEMTVHHRWLKIYAKSINAFIAPSAFMKNKLVEFGWPEEKIKVVINPFSSTLAKEMAKVNSLHADIGLQPNSNLPKNIAASKTEDYFLYFGRLSPEKGLSVLIKAITISGSRLKLAGSGEEEETLRYLAKEQRAEAQFLGFKSGANLAYLIAGAKAVVIPSIWYENMPLSLLEALSLGKPVIASRIGGLPEIIEPGKNGWLFTPGDVEECAACLKNAQRTDLEAMASACRESVAQFSPAANLAGVIETYQEVLKK